MLRPLIFGLFYCSKMLFVLSVSDRIKSCKIYTIWRGTLGFSVLRFLLFFRSVFRFLCQKTSVFRFWCLLRFADFSLFSFWFSVFLQNISGFLVLVSDVVFVSFPQKRNGIVLRSGVNYLHSD